MKKILTASLLLSGLMALGAGEITIEKPYFRWLWGGFGAMVRSFATDLGPMGIRVNMLAPGYIWTDRWNWLSDDVKAKRRSNTLTGHESDGRDVAEGVAFLASAGARTFQGARLVMDSGSSVQLYPDSCEDDTSNMRQS